MDIRKLVEEAGFTWFAGETIATPNNLQAFADAIIEEYGKRLDHQAEIAASTGCVHMMEYAADLVRELKSK